MDRRQGGRCPVCQGPAVADATKPGGIRCRSSICLHNHSEVECPRCKAKDLDSVSFDKGAYHYTCKDCQNRWQAPAT